MRLRQQLVALCGLLGCLATVASAAATAGTNHWAFQPLASPPPPKVRDIARVTNPVDLFVLARLEAAGLRLSPPAPPPALLRRLAFDLTGLPPVLGKLGLPGMDRQLPIADAIEQLLASPQFGERWGRWWLDAVGYVDVMGIDNDATIIKLGEGKWRYRDYVVQSFNADKPFDRFLPEQLAGDELVDWRSASELTDEMRTLLVATGFLRVAADDTDEPELNTPAIRHAHLQQTAEVIAGNLLGLTLNCARCHDHKYEPISQADYYGFVSHFAPALNPAAWVTPKDRVLADVPKPVKADYDRQNAELDKEVEAFKQQQQTIRDRYRDAILETRLPQVPSGIRDEAKTAARTLFEKRTEEQRRLVGRFERLLRVTTDEVKAALTPQDKTEWDRFDREIASVNARRQTPPQIHAVYDTGKPTPVHILRRGEVDKPAEEVMPALPALLRSHLKPVGRDSVEPHSERSEASAASISPGRQASRPDGPTSGRRLALAQQLTAPGSPASALVARVFVNRVWQQLFDRGLVETSENLGVSGARPSHPELLDWLAGEFIRNGWRLKPLLRLILSSSTYQQASATETQLVTRAQSADPGNSLLWHQRLRRLDSEMVRDSLLLVSGRLNLKPGGPPILTTNLLDGAIVINESLLQHPEEKSRRSLYLLQRRNYHPSLLATFDQPSLPGNCLRRQTSAVVSQPLTMLNDDFVLEQASRLAQRVCREQPDTESRIGSAFRIALSRQPTPMESKWCREAVESEGVRRLLAGDAMETARSGALAHLCHTLLNTSEFLSIP